MTKTIEIIVTAKGETTRQTGASPDRVCRDASRFIEQALGQRIGEQLTAEFHQVSSVQAESAAADMRRSASTLERNRRRDVYCPRVENSPRGIPPVH